MSDAGRGCVGGELVFCGVRVIGDVSFADDSKKTTFKQREVMVDKIKANVQHCTVVTSAADIDKKGLAQCLRESLETIIEYFGKNEKYLYDGNKTWKVDNPNLETLVKADALVKGVGAASIIAKHLKDSLMLEHDKEFPEYNFASNQGYVTKAHIQAIKEHGYCKYHRKSYKIKELEKWKNEQTTDLLF